MELKDFVAQTITQVILGVKESQEQAKSNDATVNPRAVAYNGYSVGHTNNGSSVHMIEFDVAITTSDEGQAKGGIGIFVGEIGIGTQAQVNSKDSKISRIKFSVPVVFPLQS